MIDGVDQINQVTRVVRGSLVDGAQVPAVVIKRTYDAPIEEVWDACTDPARIRRWFLPVSGELRVGGRYQLEGNAGGTIERCEPPRSFRISWEFGGNTSWLELRLTEPTVGTTQFELEHIAPGDDGHWAQYGPGAVGVGWDLGLLGLGPHLEADGDTADPAAVSAWSASEPGRRYITMSSRAWADAAIAAGADPADARAAAARTTAFYTGTPAAS